jgi:hypothetical protein
MTIWNTVDGMRDREVSATVTLGQALDLVSNKSLEPIAEIRNINIGDYIV